MADEKLVPGDEVRNAIVDVEVVKVKVDHIASPLTNTYLKI